MYCRVILYMKYRAEFTYIMRRPLLYSREKKNKKGEVRAVIDKHR